LIVCLTGLAHSLTYPRIPPFYFFIENCHPKRSERLAQRDANGN
jgi:hypothetical protein